MNDTTNTVTKTSPFVTEKEDSQLLMRLVAMPANTNAQGSIFGGWIMSQMDLAASNLAHTRTPYRAVTASVDGMNFMQPVYVGDIVSCYGKIIGEGTTSMKIRIEVWALRDRQSNQEVKVTEATFVFVALGEDGKPIPLPPKA